MTNQELNEAVARKFWDKVRKTPGCWFWTGSKTKNGYGRFYPKWKIKLMAHHFSYRLSRGEWCPDGFVVMHTCDVRDCVNPDHLVVGTQSQNLQDMANKDRRILKLRTDQVRQIKGLKGCGLSLAQLGRNFGVDKTTIWKIFRGEIWQKI